MLPIEPFKFGLDGLGGAAGEGERSIGETKRCAGEGERSIGETNCFAGEGEGEGDRSIGETKRCAGDAGTTSLWLSFCPAFMRICSARRRSRIALPPLGMPAAAGAGDAGDAGEWVLLGTISSIMYTGRPSGVEEPAC